MELIRNGRKRVAITGLGVVSPLGNKDEFWDAIAAGKSGIRQLQNIDTAHLNVKIGAKYATLTRPTRSRPNRRAVWAGQRNSRL